MEPYTASKDLQAHVNLASENEDSSIAGNSWFDRFIVQSVQQHPPNVHQKQLQQTVTAADGAQQLTVLRKQQVQRACGYGSDTTKCL